MSPDWTPHDKGNGYHDHQPFRVPLLTWQSVHSGSSSSNHRRQHRRSPWNSVQKRAHSRVSKEVCTSHGPSLSKGPDECSLESLQDVIKKINAVVPRVGKWEVSETATLQELGHLFNDKEIVKVVACRGTDRMIGPPNNLLAAQASFRK